MYSFIIYLMAFGLHIAAWFNNKVHLMIRGQHATWQLLRQHQGEGSYVWFHAASLGEFEQGRPLMEWLKRNFPEKKILLSFFSPSGYEVRKNYQNADLICYLPLDTPLNARKFLKLANIESAYFIKYEFWRNYIDALSHRHIPLYSVSSIFRPNQIFFRWYGRNYASCLHKFTHLYVQNENSRKLLARIGITQTTVVGDTRLDRVIEVRNNAKNLPLVERFAGCWKILVVGSSWQPDEDIILPWFNTHEGIKLVLAPHVVSEEHLRQIETKITRPTVRYSAATPKNVAESDCLIIDCYGLLSSIYRYATIAYVGGGFGAGIHNVPEAAVYGVPIVFGPNNKKFREAQCLLSCGACREIDTADNFSQVMASFLSDKEELKKSGEAAANYILHNTGATELIMKSTMRYENDMSIKNKNKDT